MTNHYDYLVAEAIEKGKKDSISEMCIYDTVRAHDQLGGNYEWLWPHYGRVLWIDFEEPVNSGHWRTYDRYWWGRHAALISHNPKDLVESHVKAYVDPTTKIINLRFWFITPSGKVYSTAPTAHFYELEQDYFDRWQLCTNIKDYPIHHDNEPSGPNYLYNKPPSTNLSNNKKSNKRNMY